MKLLFPKELIDENLEGFKEKVTRTLKLFPKAVVPRDIHGEIVYPAVNHPPDTHCKEKRLGGSRMPLDRRRKRCENTIRAKTLAADAQKILAEQFSSGRPLRSSREGMACARPDYFARQKPFARHARTGKKRPRSAEILYRNGPTVPVDPGNKRSASAEISRPNNLADQIARPRQIHRPSAQNFLGQGKSPFH
ncbi:unnamed protein product [Microthlaspi erraticum]|uniref:Uncharacterized protein n=1 Tax=Microthlaspi erraticum TaxID=1685480 RepID=A0A6D2JHP6_9BRAS|nr:unnamed protein product [Microthlaspi erraticum]